MADLFKDASASFYDPAAYRKIARDNTGIGATFIVFLTLLMVVFSLIVGYFPIRGVIDNAAAILADMPIMSLKDGNLSVIDKPVPYQINLGEGAEAAHIVIDTNYKATDPAVLQEKMKQEKILVLITQDAVITRQKDELRVKSLKDIKSSVDIDHAQWQKLAQGVKDWGFAAVVAGFAIFGFIGIFLFNLVATFCTAVVISIAGAAAGASLAFDAAMRLAAALRIPVALLSFIPAFVGLGAHSAAISWLLWIGYIILAVTGSKRGAGARP